LKITAEFVRSAAAAGDTPGDGLPQIALVGRSNVGKSSIVNALARRPVARTSAKPGKTRLLNIYRVARGSAAPLYFVDLPGYGYARGRRAAGSAPAGGAEDFEALTREYFARRQPAALLLVDARHPGLPSDRGAWAWLQAAAAAAGLVATKIDKLARGERIRALRDIESVFHHPVVPVSASTGEGLDELWKLIDRLANPPPPPRPLQPPPAGPLPR
jgi:GTP-binding protein